MPAMPPMSIPFPRDASARSDDAMAIDASVDFGQYVGKRHVAAVVGDEVEGYGRYPAFEQCTVQRGLVLTGGIV